MNALPKDHASSDSCWEFCYFNNMATALLSFKHEGRIGTASILDTVSFQTGRDGAYNR